MYELLVLALLMHWPLYAYLIADIANHILGPWERISRGTLSSLLTRLEQAGLIAPADPAQVPFPSDRPTRVFAITPAGRERFHQTDDGYHLRIREPINGSFASRRCTWNTSRQKINSPW